MASARPIPAEAPVTTATLDLDVIAVPTSKDPARIVCLLCAGSIAKRNESVESEFAQFGRVNHKRTHHESRWGCSCLSGKSFLASDTDPVGQEEFNQPDKKDMFTELLSLSFHRNLHTDTLTSGLRCLLPPVLWSRSKRLSAPSCFGCTGGRDRTHGLGCRHGRDGWLVKGSVRIRT